MQSLSYKKRYVKDCFLIGRTHTYGFRKALQNLTVFDAVMDAATTDRFLQRAIKESGLWEDLYKAHTTGSWDVEAGEQLSLPLGI
jgi:hypothetical protein